LGRKNKRPLIFRSGARLRYVSVTITRENASRAAEKREGYIVRCQWSVLKKKTHEEELMRCKCSVRIAFGIET
jgi:hypothetical protein